MWTSSHGCWSILPAAVLPQSKRSKREKCESHSVVSDSLRPHGLYSLWNSPGQNTGVGSHSPLQGTFPTQGSNPCLPHCKQIIYHLSHQGLNTESRYFLI